VGPFVVSGISLFSRFSLFPLFIGLQRLELKLMGVGVDQVMVIGLPVAGPREAGKAKPCVRLIVVWFFRSLMLSFT